MSLSNKDISCTTIPGHQLAGGSEPDKELSKYVLKVDLVIALLTPNFLKSTYVMFELGARWASEKKLKPLLACGTGYQDVDQPLAKYHMQKCSIRTDLYSFLHEIAEDLDLRLQNPASYEKHLKYVG